jgi:metal-responsive CopG/Arc/MetJ family transcriptional regulator
MVEIHDTRIRELDTLAKEEKRSRAALIREAIDDYLAGRRKKHERGAFGLWGKRKLDGLVHQEKMRHEW